MVTALNATRAQKVVKAKMAPASHPQSRWYRLSSFAGRFTILPTPIVATCGIAWSYPLPLRGHRVALHVHLKIAISLPARLSRLSTCLGILDARTARTVMLGIAFWYGVAMCDTQSYPEQLETCTPDSDSNVTEASDRQHVGTAFTELQLYPPGYVQQFNGSSCSAAQWCVALTIDSLSENPENRRTRRLTDRGQFP